METGIKKPRSNRASRRSSPPPASPRRKRPTCKSKASSPAAPCSSPPPSPRQPTPQNFSESRNSAPQPPLATPTINPHPSSSQAISSGSARMRAQGNALYKQALEGGFCSTISRGKISRAFQLYTEALHASSSPDETASCFKNLGMLHWLSCKLELNELLHSQSSHDELRPPSTKQLSVCKFYLYDAIRYILKAKEHGENCKPMQWVDQLQDVMNSIAEWAVDQSSFLPISHSPLLQYLCEAFENMFPVINSTCLVAYKHHANALFKEALTMRLPDTSMDYKGCRSMLHDCSVPLRKGSCYLALAPQDSSLQQEMQELEDSVRVQLCICEAMQAISLGDMSLSEALFDEEDMNMEKVKDALDYYREASLATRELDVETEAIAMSRIGKIYSDVLKLHVMGHKFHLQAISLALTVMSLSIGRADWYKFSLGRVKAHQEMVAAEEKEQHEKDQEPALRRLKEKVAALSRQASYSAESFLKYVYAEHPHPDLKRNVVPIVGTSAKVKASLKKAIQHYHPDSNAQYGQDWKVLCEEVCKHLNNKYGCFKDIST